MSEETAGDVQTQEEIVPEVSDETYEDFYDEVEVSEGQREEVVSKETPEPVEDTTEKKSKETTPTSQDEKKTEEPTADYYKSKIGELEGHIRNLNIALSQERSEKKELKAADEEPLTESQLRQLYREHKDDPDTLFNIMQYQIKQGAKKAGEESVNAADMSRKRAAVDQYLGTYWPAMNDPTSKLRQTVDNAKRALNLEDHPIGDMAGLGLAVLDGLPTLQKTWYEQGKEDGLKDKSEEKRKESVKQSKAAPSGKKSGPKTSKQLTGQALETARQMGLSKNQMKIYSSFLGKDNDEMMEAS